ncbi:MAG: hypothetical protein IJH11_02065, partial [Lachnospiraceae bacterium]|nr:hypothetical protein [Lachnospiraceae bacterium]
EGPSAAFTKIELFGSKAGGSKKHEAKAYQLPLPRLNCLGPRQEAAKSMKPRHISCLCQD